MSDEAGALSSRRARVERGHGGREHGWAGGGGTVSGQVGDGRHPGGVSPGPDWRRQDAPQQALVQNSARTCTIVIDGLALDVPVDRLRQEVTTRSQHIACISACVPLTAHTNIHQHARGACTHVYTRLCCVCARACARSYLLA